MRVWELIEALEEFDDNDLVVVFFRWDGENVLDDIIDYSKNGPAIQLNTRSTEE